MMFLTKQMIKPLWGLLLCNHHQLDFRQTIVVLYRRMNLNLIILSQKMKRIKKSK